MPGYPTVPAPETKRKKSIFDAALSPYFSKQTTEQMNEDFERTKLQVRNARAKNALQKEKNLYKKLTEVNNQFGGGSVPDYLGLHDSPKKKRDPWGIDF